MLTKIQKQMIKTRRKQGYKVHAIALELKLSQAAVRTQLRKDTARIKYDPKETDERKILLRAARRDLRDGYDLNVVAAVYGLNATERQREENVLARRKLLAEIKESR